MAMNSRARRGRSDAQRIGPGSRPAPTGDPRRRQPARPKPRLDRPASPQAPSLARPESALEAVLDDFTASWERGEGPKAERYLDRIRFEDSAELIYHEYCLAEASELTPDPADYLRRFPHHTDRLSRLFSLHGAFSGSTLRGWVEPSDLPEAGDEIGPYRLLRELGRGAFARVFLAEQADLDRRLVVLKVSTRSTAEPRLLARARHPHIVEVLRHATTDDGSLHLVCMPFLGGATLASVLEARRALGRPARTGADLLADLDRASAPEYPSAELLRPAREVIAGLTHPKALAWVVARLAEALDHAHGRGVAHGDLKPSNILLTAEATPLLLDMNLSTDWRGNEEGAVPDGQGADLGGTPAYMAPERLLAIARGGAASSALDSHRSDLYALGLVLLEALTGVGPEVPRSRPKDPRDLARALAGLRQDLPGPLRGRGRRSIPPSLRSILTKCLCPDPAGRHARGNELAEDLDLWRSDLPLAFAREPRRSAFARRARRHRFPLIAAGLTLAAALMVASVASALLTGSKGDVADLKYGAIIDRPDPEVFGFRRFGDWRDEAQDDPAEVSARHLARYGVAVDPNWPDRDDIRYLPERERGEVQVWLLEQVIRHAAALRQRSDEPEAWARGLGLLERTFARFPSPTLAGERSALLGRMGLPSSDLAPSPRPAPPRWMESYLAGVVAEPTHPRDALRHYDEALSERPDLLWAHYRAAVVAGRIGEFDLAVDRLRGCVARRPENPAFRLQLAAALSYAERSSDLVPGRRPLAEALEQCDQAVEIAPDFAWAYQTRSWIRKTSGWAEGARADLERLVALSSRKGPASALGLAFYHKLIAGRPFSQQPEDVQSLSRKILEANPRDFSTRTNLGAMLGKDDRPWEAVLEFDKVLETYPGHLRARYQKALMLMKLDSAKAISEFTALIDDPRFDELLVESPPAFRAYHYVSSDLMDRGRFTEALEVARRGLVHVNRSRPLSNQAIFARQRAGDPVAISPKGETHYLIAQIHAAAARSDPGHLDQVVAHLSQAFARNEAFRDGWFAKDRQFDDLRRAILRRLETDAIR